jgi:hypothetical protein
MTEETRGSDRARRLPSGLDIAAEARGRPIGALGGDGDRGRRPLAGRSQVDRGVIMASEISVRKPFPEWAEYRPNRVWIYDIHFARAKAAITIVEGLVPRKWLGHIVSHEDASTQSGVSSMSRLPAPRPKDQRAGDPRMSLNTAEIPIAKSEETSHDYDQQTTSSSNPECLRAADAGGGLQRQSDICSPMLSPHYNLSPTTTYA